MEGGGGGYLGEDGGETDSTEHCCRGGSFRERRLLLGVSFAIREKRGFLEGCRGGEPGALFADVV